MERDRLSLRLRGILGAALATLFTACGHQGPTVEPMGYIADLAPSYGEASKIIGDNTLVPIKSDGSNIDSNLRPYLDAIGLIAMGSSGACSGTHLGNGYVLTAGHCFFEETFVGKRILQNKTCSQVKVYWGYRGSPQTGNPKPLVSLQSECTKIIYAEQTQQRDFAIFRVDNAPKVQIGVTLETRRTQVGTKLTFLGYPQGRPLEWSQYCALQSSSAAGARAIKGQSTFVHTCDTEAGNSGSAAIAFSSNGQPKVVGVHDGAAPLGADFNYGTYLYDIQGILKSQGFDLIRSVTTVSTHAEI